MREVPISEYLEFVSRNREVVVEDQVIRLDPIEVKRLDPLPEELTDVSTTVWSFPVRGGWATHRGDYRGNWAPQIPRALILMYTRPGDVVLDPMVGSGTTLIEAKLLGRNSIGVDINYNAVMLALHRLYYLEKALAEYLKRLRERAVARGGGAGPALGDATPEDVERAWYKAYHGDARRLSLLGSESVDLVATHPPYFNIIDYGGGERPEGDLSAARDLEEYLRWVREVAGELYRVLKPGKYCAILVGDTRVHKHYVPISHYVLQAFLDAGFLLKEEVIKVQHKMKTTREVWSRVKNRDFLLIYHEKLFILRKPGQSEEGRPGRLKYSGRQPFIKFEL
ncbi:site-specific DNA-methyltransferase [Thermogladius sp. KZ2Tp1]|uniref:DNA methyltransferase n=1 Tax=Thermogladius sp. KZ2Tp1 TaxID=3136289 RepID=UPI003DA7C040